jgi:hypothetical protein
VAVTADLLTFSRLIAAGILVWLGLQGPQTLPVAIAVSVLAWSTDQLDGWAARRATSPTRLAPADFAIDRVLYGATLAYLVLAGYVPAGPAAVFVVAALSLSVIYRRKAVDVLAVRLIDLLCAVIIFQHKPLIGCLLIVWLAILVVIYRRRVAQRVPQWFVELARLAGLKWRGSEKTH